MNRTLTACLLAGIFVLPAFAQSLTPGQQKYRALFQELVETNTQLSNGDCTALAQKRQENTRLREQIRRLREDPATIESLAREELGLIRDGEVLFILRDADPARRSR